MRAKKTHAQKVANQTYRVRILAPDSATKWVPTQLLAGEVQELKAKPAARKRAKPQPSAPPNESGSGHAPGPGRAEAA